MDGPSPVSKRRLTIYFVVLALVAAAVAVAVITLGEDEHAEESIAGGYDVTLANPCLGGRGQQFDLEQSGRYVSIESTGKGPGGKLELRDGHLTGDADCAGGGSAPIDARISGDALKGSVGARPVAAEQRRDPRAPGVQKQRAPGSIDGEYALSPRSACLGGAIELTGEGPFAVHAGEREAGNVAYADGKLAGRVTCSRGAPVRLTGEAAGRQITLTAGAEKVT